ncbi:hypothetical protein CUJ83_06215 [Methanocella sp. CWC-04]|uniref:Uncharacterized protein n=1 Tax=Methanooceanicella nereidis TaxID=2052831 RepID=A0AAP2W6Z4_9EURY|nr:hypothetical protein [Methanocella sp. CWC-04]MCD1294596.1 hypothetical protein [Methanocella sp. CWC-04]
MDIKIIDRKTLEKIKSLKLPERKESSPYVVLHVYGDGIRASPKWNAKVYMNSKGELKLVTVDLSTLEDMLSGGMGRQKEKVLKVDDAGWGFPLGGVMIGVTDEARVETGIVEVKYFQGERFESKDYLYETARVTKELVSRFNASPENTRIEICTGYVNTMSRTALREEGYDVTVVEIKGLLQDELEKRFKEYVKSLGYKRYFDPKETHDIGYRFSEVIKWIEEKPEDRMKLAKTGWKYFKSGSGP